jgi:hypothetical protein
MARIRVTKIFLVREGMTWKIDGIGKVVNENLVDSG